MLRRVFCAVFAVSLLAASSVTSVDGAEECLGCHKKWYEQQFVGANLHGPFREGRCGVCHQEDFVPPEMASLSRVKSPAKPGVQWSMTRDLLPGRHVLPLRSAWAGHHVVVEMGASLRTQRSVTELPFPATDGLPLMDCPSSPPSVTGLRVVEVEQDVTLQAKIAWETDRPTKGLLYYKEEGGVADVLNEEHFATSHRADLFGLRKGRSYRLYVEVTDLVGHKGVSPETVMRTDSPVKALPGTNPATGPLLWDLGLKRHGDEPVLEVECEQQVVIRVGRSESSLELLVPDDKEPGKKKPHPRLLPAAKAALAVCEGCHRNKRGGQSASHPVDIPLRKGMSPPEDLKLVEGVMTCTSCHEPHGTKNAFLLRRSQSLLCNSCHSVTDYGAGTDGVPLVSSNNVRISYDRTGDMFQPGDGRQGDRPF